MFVEALKFDPDRPRIAATFAPVLKFDSTQPRDAHGRWVANLVKARQEWIPFALEGYPGAMEAVENINRLLDQTPEGKKHRVALWDPSQPRDKKGRWAKQGIPATMAAFKAKYPAVAENYPRSSHTEMGSIEEHTGDVGREWLTQLTPEELKGISDRFGSDVEAVMMAAIPLHDIGKAEAIESGHGKEAQHEFTIPILQDVMRKEGFSDKDITLATELTNHDLIGPLFRGYEGFKSNEAKVVQALKDKAQKVGMSVSDFVTLQLAFYQADASAYPYVTQFMRQESSGKWTFKGNKKIAAIEALLQSSAKREYVREPAGSPESKGGQFAKATGPQNLPFHYGREFTSEEGYQWHEKGPVAEWVKNLPHTDVKALDNYAGFGYHDTNDLRRGTYKVPIKSHFVRAATPEEMRRVGWDPEKNEWVPSIKVKEGEYKPGYPVDPRDAVTPESIARFGHPMGRREPQDFDPDDPYHRVEDGRIFVNQYYRPVEGGPPMMFSIQRAGPDLERLARVEQDAAALDDLIANRGYELPEAIVVQRGAYLPGVSFEQLQAMQYEGPDGEEVIWEEKGFTSTAVGDAGGRMKSYPALGKWESITHRFGTASGVLTKHQDEVGSAVRFFITLPKGTKVASVEAARRVRHEYPRIPNPEPMGEKELADPFWQQHPELWQVTDYTQAPAVDAKDLEAGKEGRRTESEVLLGSGARFRVIKVKRGDIYRVSDPTLKDVPIIEVHLEYIGGGSSEGVRH